MGRPSHTFWSISDHMIITSFTWLSTSILYHYLIRLDTKIWREIYFCKRWIILCFCEIFIFCFWMWHLFCNLWFRQEIYFVANLIRNNCIKQTIFNLHAHLLMQSEFARHVSGITLFRFAHSQQIRAK